jgi:hypothetical protein
MSRFNNENAGELAKHAFKLRVDDPEQEQRKTREAAPLLGKEVQLLMVLREAEQAYDEWIDSAPVRNQVQQLIATFPRDCERLRKHLQRVLDCWSGMREYEGQYELACRVPDLEARDDVSRLIRRIDETLRQMLLGAQSGSEDVQFSYPGRPPGKAKSGVSLVALEEFTKVVRAFWVKEVSDVFGYDQTTIFDDPKDANKGRREPTSAAARLIEGAARILDPRYNLGNVRQVMEAVYRNPEPN